MKITTLPWHAGPDSGCLEKRHAAFECSGESSLLSRSRSGATVQPLDQREAARIEFVPALRLPLTGQPSAPRPSQAE
jgi:hypothetical protein